MLDVNCRHGQPMSPKRERWHSAGLAGTSHCSHEAVLASESRIKGEVFPFQPCNDGRRHANLVYQCFRQATLECFALGARNALSCDSITLSYSL